MPILTTVMGNGAKHVGRFMFDKKWSKKPEMMELVRKRWNAPQPNNTSSVIECIASCRKVLAKWKRTEVSNSKKMIEKLRVELEEEDKKIAPNMREADYLELTLEHAQNILNQTSKLWIGELWTNELYRKKDNLDKNDKIMAFSSLRVHHRNRVNRFCFSVVVNRNNAAVVSWESECRETVTLRRV
ncbi:hypothetical protein YC2023_015487 [Brassica napus]